jgi:radical SAM protein with 4Fe4S-binding SPASM domain
VTAVNRRDFALIFLPTLVCDARCDYCFEDRSTPPVSLEDFAAIFGRVLDYMDARQMGTLHLYWQGGEILTLEPAWIERANGIMRALSGERGRTTINHLQSNLLAYDPKWNPVIAGVFNNSVGTSMDFPNRHRRMPGGTPEAYTERWTRSVRELRQAGVNIGVISVPNAETLEMGAQALYTFLVDETGVGNFQINSPFPGGRVNDVKRSLPLDARALGRFLVDLMDLWLLRGRSRGVKVGPCTEVLNYFLDGGGRLPCFWQDNCANGFICIDPKGNVAQCDCWVASYPEMRFGNILETPLAELLDKSPARREFLDRPGALMADTDCIDCEHLAICHGGCPVRAFSTYGRLAEKDPYCETYKMLFSHAKEQAARIASCPQ